MFGRMVLNTFEDYRINILLREIYPGFWQELDKTGDRLACQIAQCLEDAPTNILETDLAAQFVLNLATLHQCGKNHYFYRDGLKNPSNCFKFASIPLGTFWKRAIVGFDYIRKYRTFTATIIAGAIFIEAFKRLMDQQDPKTKEDDPKPQSVGEGDPRVDSPKRHDDPGSGGQEKRPSEDNDDFQALLDFMEGSNRSKIKDNMTPFSTKFKNRKLKKRHKSGFDSPKLPVGTFTSHDNPKLRERLSKQQFQNMDLNSLVDPGKLTPPRKVPPYNPVRIMLSGVPTSNLPASEKDRLRCIDLVLNRRDSSEILHLPLKLESEMESGRQEMIALMRRMKERTPRGTMRQPPDIDVIKDGDKKIEIEIITDPSGLAEVNDVADPIRHYAAIVSDEHFLIQQLQKTLISIKRREGFERMHRRGITCGRDLARVIASNGKFDRPFMSNERSRGARLLVVVDESGSMSGGDERPRFGKPATSIGIAKHAAIILAEALKDSRIKFGIVGFSAVGSTLKIIEKVYKSFDEPVRPEKIGAMWVSNRSPENRDGTSFKAIARRHFRHAGTDIPIMIVISDGQPEHGGTDYAGAKGMKETEKAVMDLRQHIKMFAISIDPSGKNYLASIYGEKNYVVLSNPTELVEKLTHLVRNIATSLG